MAATQSVPTLTWLVTGCSTGIGREIVLYALAHNQRVIATGRSAARLSDLAAKGAHVEEIDVNVSAETINQFASKIINTFGGIDVLVNNAGYVQAGTIEEAGHDQLVQQFSTNVFAVMNVARAFLPTMRKQRSGTILMIGSVAAYEYLPAAGLYDASKAALRALTHALAAEVKDLGIRVSHIEPGMFRTAVFGSTSSQKGLGTPEIPDYQKIREATLEYFKAQENAQLGDPAKLAQVLLDTVFGIGAAQGKVFPEALMLGSDALKLTRGILKADVERLEAWAEVSKSTDFPS